MELDKCPKCGGTVEVIERSLEYWGKMNCRAVAPAQQATNSAIRPCPYKIEERYADNGALSHYALVEVATGVEVWSQPE